MRDQLIGAAGSGLLADSAITVSRSTWRVALRVLSMTPRGSGQSRRVYFLKQDVDEETIREVAKKVIKAMSATDEGEEPESSLPKP